MYKQDKIGVDVRIDGMRGELDYEIKGRTQLVESLEKQYEEAHKIADAAMAASCEAYFELMMAKRRLAELESIDARLRQAKEDVNRAYNDWLKLQ